MDNDDEEGDWLPVSGWTAWGFAAVMGVGVLVWIWVLYAVGRWLLGV